MAPLPVTSLVRFFCAASSTETGCCAGVAHRFFCQVTGGFAYVACLFAVTLCVAVGSGAVESWLEGTLTALALALSSTSVVMDTLVHARLRDTLYGTVVIEVMAVT